MKSFFLKSNFIPGWAAEFLSLLSVCFTSDRSQHHWWLVGCGQKCSTCNHNSDAWFSQGHKLLRFTQWHSSTSMNYMMHEGNATLLFRAAEVSINRVSHFSSVLWFQLLQLRCAFLYHRGLTSPCSRRRSDCLSLPLVRNSKRKFQCKNESLEMKLNVPEFHLTAHHYCPLLQHLHFLLQTSSFITRYTDLVVYRWRDMWVSNHLFQLHFNDCVAA